MPKKRTTALLPATMTRQEARLIVDMYYQIQDHRKALGNQIAQAEAAKEPTATLQFFFDRFKDQEKEAKQALDAFTSSDPMGVAVRSVDGIGPVLAAGLIAHIDITRAKSAGAVWRFAGLDPTQKWLPKTKRPWNAALKVIAWKCSQSFIKRGPENSYYARVAEERKALEAIRNANGFYAEQAAAALASKRYGKDTEAYKAYIQGRLPKGHLHARAQRYSVKLFLSHLFDVFYQLHFNQTPPRPYVIEHLGHVDYVSPEVAGWKW